MGGVRVVMVPGWEDRVNTAALPHLRRITDEVADDARQNVRSGHSTSRSGQPKVGHIVEGDLLRSIERRGLRVYIGTDSWHFIEYGTRPHIIMPRVKQALWWPGARHPVRMVRHPGNRPYAVMRRALRTKRGKGRG